MTAEKIVEEVTEQPRVSKRDFISRVSIRTGLSIRLVSEVYEAILDELRDLVRDRRTVVLTGFGRFYLQEHKGHKVRFGKSAVKDYAVLKFSASRSMNRALDDEREESSGQSTGTARSLQAIS